MRRLFRLALTMLPLIGACAAPNPRQGNGPPLPVTTPGSHPTAPVLPSAPSPVASPQASAAPVPSPGSMPEWWRPPLRASWQWQLTTPVDLSVDAHVYDIDLFDNDAEVVASLHARGRKVLCYMSAGTFEDWRPDAGRFPSAVLGSANGWPGERWLDIRRLDVLRPIMEARMDLCKAKGFDGVEPDNVDGYANSTGFPITYQDQIAFNTFLADAAHARGLAVGLKNDLDQVRDLVGLFDFALVEQCFKYEECDALKPFIQAGKPVFAVEYELPVDRFCSQARALGFNAIKKSPGLGADVQACP